MSEKKKVSSKRERLDTLVREFNDLEDSAFEKFKEIFYILKSGEGYRKVYLKGGGLLSNCWDNNDRLDMALTLSRYQRGIEKIDIANPKSLGFKD